MEGEGCTQPITKKHYFEKTRGSRGGALCIEYISIVLLLEGVSLGIPIDFVRHFYIARMGGQD